MLYEDDDDFKAFEYEGGDKPGKYDDAKNGFKVKDEIKEDGGFARYNNRGCTDVLFLLVFWAAMGLMLFLGVDGLMKGQPGKLLAPLDGDKKFCGIDDGYEEYGVLFIPLKNANLISLFNNAVCVKSCPAKDEPSDCKTTSSMSECPTPAYNSGDTYGVGYCLPLSMSGLPESTKMGLKTIKDSFLNSASGQYVIDISKAWRSVVSCALLSFVICIAYVKLMSAFAECIAWLCVVLIQVGLFALSAAGYFAKTWVDEQYAAKPDEEKDEKTDKEYEKNVMACWGIVIVFGLLALIFLCAICCGFKHLKLAIDVIDASADFLDDTKRIYIVPFCFFLCAFVSIIVWTVCVIGVYSEGKISADPVVPQVKKVEVTEMQKYMLLYLLFAILWLTAWFEYANSFVVMHSAVQYYFMYKNEGKDEVGEVGVIESVKCAFFKHPGSIAVGAFVIALIRFVRIVFVYIAKQIEKQSGDNPAVKMMMKCAHCYLWCLEKICDYINESAYAYMAVSGENFCSSAWNGFLLNLKHLAKFTFANTIAKAFVALGKFAITVSNMGLAYFIMGQTGSIDQVSSMWGPLFCVAAITYVTASIFLGLLDQTVMGMMTSLAIDMDIHNGDHIFGPKTFHDGIGKVDKRVEPTDDGAMMMANPVD